MWNFIIESFTTIALKGLTLKGESESVGNLSVSLNLTLGINEKVKHYIRIKTHKPNSLS